MARNVEPTTSTGWSSGQAYALALVCLAIGLIIGYLFRGSESQAPAAPSSAQTQQAGGGGAAMPAGTIPGSMPSQMQVPAEMLQQEAQPFLNALNQNPNDTDALTKLGNLYYDAQQFPKAVDYYGQALAKDPKNVNVRTDMGTAYWYMGNPDRAISEFERSLSYSPNHPQTLFNMGMVKWQGKKDPKGAVAAWEQLLKSNPDYPERSKVESYIAQAKQHASR